MDTKYRLLQIDYWIQTIIGVAIIACCATLVGIMFGIMGLIPLGGAQVLSGLVFAIFYKDRKRINYLCFVALFFLLWYISSEITANYSLYHNGFMDAFNLILCFIPLFLAVKYYNLTTTEYKELKRDKGEQYLNDEQVLDA
jgi:hypothetical protein